MANRKQSFLSQEHLVNSLYQEARPLASTVSVASLGFAGRLTGPQVNRDLVGRKAFPVPSVFRSYIQSGVREAWHGLFGPESSRASCISHVSVPTGVHHLGPD